MKYRIAFTYVFIFLGLSFYAQRTITSIDTLVHQLKNNQENFRQVEKLKSAEGSRTNYYEGAVLRLCVVKEFDKIEKSVIWIFSDQKILYTETNWRDAATGKQLFQEKTYHDTNGMFAWLSAEHTFEDANSEKFRRLDREIKVYVDKLLEEVE